MARAEVIESLQRLGTEIEEYADDNAMAVVNDQELEFWFAKDGAARLRQIAVDGDGICWTGKPLLGERLDAALRAITPTAAVWEAYDATDEPFPDPEQGAALPRTDEDLLEESTVWLPERGLGLVICEGEVNGVVWRATQDLPSQFVGPVTEAQRQLSMRSDLAEYLREKRTERYKLEERKDPLRWPRKVLTLLAIVALLLVGKKGIEEMQVWNQAPTLQAKLVAVEQVPMKQFRDYLPPALRWVVPKSRTVIVEGYRVAFTLPDGEPQEVVLERGELYVAPQKPGEEVPVVYVAGDPPRVKGLSRARDSAFVDYIPWAITIGAVYLLAQFVLSLLPALFRRLPNLVGRLAPTGVVKDPNRPELR